MDELLKQAQAMQGRVQQLQQQLAEAEVTGESGAGLVKVVMNGRHDVRRVMLDDGLLREDKEVLEDLLAAAVNDAVRKIERKSQDLMRELTGGLDLPAGFRMPFQA